ncbi:hypothetical protein [Bacillus sp. CECT 9360]|uniref:hypothetical protein n=1 Tax=Bacillus sp. CECT 9360 TaxID=2845821 RepID=UPI001E2C1631|nr:hypothetical protein [Bacillus sp. CECT 9360]CAH0347443.1 hypothetical protein BCI9360_03841 [Bacillus sp. CECT 9360]
MKKLGWILSVVGAFLIIGSVLYPLDFIEKTTFLVMILGGAGVMFAGSMIRSFSMLKK